MLRSSASDKQAPVKHPMDGARKRDTVGYNIRSVGFDWFDVSGLRFSSPTAIDELKTGKCAATIVRFKDLCSKDPIPNYA